MTQAAGRPNFYIILDLDPDAPWDQAAYERSVREHRSEWSRKRNGIKTHPATIAARQNLSHLRAADKVMRDPAQRRQEQAAARRIRVDSRRTRQDGFVERLDLILAKGFLYDIEFEELEDELDAVGADAAVRRRLREVEVRPFERGQANQERLDPTIESVLKANLAMLAESSLYTALATVDAEISEASPRDRLLAAADSLYRKAQRTADKTKPEVGAMQELSGLAKQIFRDDDLTRRYAISMLLAPLDELAKRYETNLARVRALDASQVQMFLSAAASKQIDPALAREYLSSYFGERNWRLEFPGAASERALQRLVPCPHCDTLNEPEVRSCQGCGHAMRLQCPRCGHEVSVRARACPQCDFRTGQRDWAEYLVEEAESALGRGGIAEVTEFAIRAEQAWPVGADSKDPLAARIHSVREGVIRLESVRDLEAKHIAELMQADRYRMALLRLAGLSVPLPSASELIAECERKVARADELTRAAEQVGMSDERKADLYLQALRVCKDYEPAMQGLESIPPPAPHELRVVVDENRLIVRLAWAQDSAAGCEWVVVRAEGIGAPISAADLPGQRASRGIHSPAWTDPDPLVGTPVRYAVYTQRGAVLSTRAAIASDVVFFIQPAELTAKPADRAIELSWTVPPNAEGIELRREEIGSAVAPIHLLAEGRERHLVDKNVKNGARYRYTIRARFADPTAGRPGAVRYAPAATAEAIPSRPPSPPPAPYAQGGPPPSGISFYDYEVVLRWPSPERGAIKILRAEPHVSLRPGDDLTEDQTVHGHLLKGSAPCRDPLRRRAGPFVQYFPVLFVDGRSYVGHPRRYLIGSEVTELTAEYLSTSVRLHWTWPETGDEALVAWDENGEPADPVAGRMQERVARTQGQVTGRYDLPVHTAKRAFVLVAVVARVNGREFVSSGAAINVQRPRVALRYEIRVVRRPGGRRSELVLRPERPTWLPALELRGRTDNRPAGPCDPVLAELPPGQSERELVSQFPLGSATPRSCRLFVADGGDSHGVHIIDPD